MELDWDPLRVIAHCEAFPRFPRADLIDPAGARATPINLLHYCSTSSSHSHSHNLHAEKKEQRLQIFRQAIETTGFERFDLKSQCKNHKTEIKCNVCNHSLSPYPLKTGRLNARTRESNRISSNGMTRSLLAAGLDGKSISRLIA